MFYIILLVTSNLQFLMIGKLKGNIDKIYDDYFILDVNGVGYLIFTSQRTLTKLEQNQFYEVEIETHVREDHIHLYGFTNLEEKNAFNILRSVKGIGTKLALGMLSHMSPAQMQSALTQQDKNAFNNLPGVGKKMSERLVIELKDKIISSQPLHGLASTNSTISAKPADNNLKSDAINALISLGVNAMEAKARVENIIANHEEINLSELIRLALQKST